MNDLHVKSIKILGTAVEFNRVIRQSTAYLSLGSGHLNLCHGRHGCGVVIGTFSPEGPLEDSWTLELNDHNAMRNALEILKGK